jgi:hypothetical protein
MKQRGIFVTKNHYSPVNYFIKMSYEGNCIVTFVSIYGHIHNHGKHSLNE